LTQHTEFPRKGFAVRGGRAKFVNYSLSPEFLPLFG